MRLTIFWRVILAQISLIALILAVSLYALSQLNQLTTLSTDILATDSACIEEEKRLLKIFLAQMRSAEKYLLLRDKVFYSHFTQGNSDFDSTLEKIATLIDTPQERDLVEQIRDLHSRYATGLTTALSRKSSWNKEKTGISDGIAAGINELIRLREEAIASKTAAARDQAAFAARVVGWLTLGGISLAVLLAYFHARGVSQPLRKLAQEMRWVGQGEFHRSLDIRAPKEVSELAQAFNWMQERLAELDAMKADFIAHVSHELRTPLTAIQEGTALLLEEIPGPLTASQREILEVMRSHSERLFRSLSSVLDLSKMEAGMMEYVRVPSDLVALIDRSAETVRLIAQKKRIQLEATCASPLPLLSFDEGRIQQVLENILSNAVKFTPEGGAIHVFASLKGDEDGQGSWVEVRVSDTGVGMPVEEAERIFDKFYQSSHHRGKSQQGTGLGLAIARHIVEAHGGRIWVESQVEEGSTFVFILPVSSNGTDGERAGALTQQNGEGVEEKVTSNIGQREHRGGTQIRPRSAIVLILLFVGVGWVGGMWMERLSPQEGVLPILKGTSSDYQEDISEAALETSPVVETSAEEKLLHSSPQRETAGEGIEEEIFQAVNRTRVEKGLPPLQQNPQLQRVARHHSEDMATRGFFGHLNPDGHDLVDRLQAEDIEDFTAAGENIFSGKQVEDPARVAVQEWLKSSSYRKNLLNPRYTEGGVGVAQEGKEKIYITQVYLER